MCRVGIGKEEWTFRLLNLSFERPRGKDSIIEELLAISLISCTGFLGSQSGCTELWSGGSVASAIREEMLCRIIQVPLLIQW